MRQGMWVVIIAVLSAACSSPPQAERIPHGYDKGRFGMTPEEVMAAYQVTQKDVTFGVYGDKIEVTIPERVTGELREKIGFTFFKGPQSSRYELFSVAVIASSTPFDEVVRRFSASYGDPAWVRHRTPSGPSGPRPLGIALWRWDTRGIFIEVVEGEASLQIRIEKKI